MLVVWLILAWVFSSLSYSLLLTKDGLFYIDIELFSYVLIFFEIDSNLDPNPNREAKVEIFYAELYKDRFNFLCHIHL